MTMLKIMRTPSATFLSGPSLWSRNLPHYQPFCTSIWSPFQSIEHAAYQSYPPGDMAGCLRAVDLAELPAQKCSPLSSSFHCHWSSPAWRLNVAMLSS
ncbi:unnamed protein product [Arctogadus glacialis]